MNIRICIYMYISSIGLGPERRRARREQFKTFQTFTKRWLKPMPDSGLDSLNCAQFHRQ